MTEWNVYMFPMGFFFATHDGKIRFGKADPLTKKILEWYEYDN